MKRIIIFALLIICSFYNLQAQNPNAPTIAVMDVGATNTTTIKSQVIYEYIIDVVNRTNLYAIVERSALDAALKEMEISSSGMIDDSTAAKLGKLAGAELILISNLIVDDGTTYLSARIVSVETGQVQNTSMLRMVDTEGFAELTNRTISQLLGLVAETRISETPGTGESRSAGTDSKGAATPAVSRFFLTLVAGGVIPVLDDSEIIDFGYSLNSELDYIIAHPGKITLTAGAGLGAAFLSAPMENGVLFPYNMLTFSFTLNAQARMRFNRFFITGKLAAGGVLSLFRYTDDFPPESESVEYSVNPAISPGLSAGFQFSDKVGISILCDWLMIFYQTYPFTALNTGLAFNFSLQGSGGKK